MSGKAGAEIANAAGRPNANGTPWTASTIQPRIGAYVEAPTETSFAADTNYIGYSSKFKASVNTLGEGSIVTGPTIAPQPDFTVPNNDNDAPGGLAQYVRAVGTIAAGGTCTIAAGAATAGAGTYECNVPGGVVAGDFFWANLVADA
jgi:hypothetical protein